MRNQEIERKYKVLDRSFIESATSVLQIRQGYLSQAGSVNTIRVRSSNDEAFITIKGPSSDGGLLRSEFEYSIPSSDAEAMFALCGNRIVEKLRYLVPYKGKVWEVDLFLGRHAGLIIAELELDSVDESFESPPWLGVELTGLPQYYNSYLAESDSPVE